VRSHPAIAALTPLGGRQLHVCRLYEPKYRGTRQLRVTRCTGGCGRLVVLTPKVFKQRARDVAALGAELEIVCDDCAGQIGNAASSVVVVGPTADERAEATRIRQAERRG
jgi:hypothetical protein